MRFFLSSMLFLIMLLLPFILFAADPLRQTVDKAQILLDEADSLVGKVQELKNLKMVAPIGDVYIPQKQGTVGTKILKEKVSKGQVLFPDATPLVFKKRDDFERATLMILDKTTQQKSRLDVEIAAYHRYGNLALYISSCQQVEALGKQSKAAFFDIWDTGLALAQTSLAAKITQDNVDKIGNKILSAWMYSAYPALSHLEHSVYDVRLVECGYYVR